MRKTMLLIALLLAAQLEAQVESGAYVYDSTGNITAIGGDTFLYDALGRLKEASVRTVTETYSYDAFGNRTAAAGATNCLGGRPCATPPLNISTASNHLSAVPPTTPPAA